MHHLVADDHTQPLVFTGGPVNIIIYIHPNADVFIHCRKAVGYIILVGYVNGYFLFWRKGKVLRNWPVAAFGNGSGQNRGCFQALMVDDFDVFAFQNLPL